MITSLSRAETVPSDFKDVLETYASQGYRIIALAQKELRDCKSTLDALQQVTREETEKDLEFLGLLVMENKIKPASTTILPKLNNCSVRTVMSTGDNVLTAISVARRSNMINATNPVYLGELEDSEKEGQQNITWRKI